MCGRAAIAVCTQHSLTVIHRPQLLDCWTAAKQRDAVVAAEDELHKAAAAAAARAAAAPSAPPLAAHAAAAAAVGIAVTNELEASMMLPDNLLTR